MKTIKDIKNEWYEANVKGIEDSWEQEEIEEQYALIEKAEAMTAEMLVSEIVKIRNAANLRNRMSIEVNAGYKVISVTCDYLYRNGGSDEDVNYLRNIKDSKSISLEGAKKFAEIVINNSELKLKVYKSLNK